MKMIVGVFCAFAVSCISHGAVNVLDFGAKGDGVTDDTAAIQAAIDAVAAAGGGKIIIPYSPKGYRIARPAKEFVDGKPCRGQLVIPPRPGLNIAFEGEMPCRLLYSYQVRPPEAVRYNLSPTRFGKMGMTIRCSTMWLCRVFATGLCLENIFAPAISMCTTAKKGWFFTILRTCRSSGISSPSTTA